MNREADCTFAEGRTRARVARTYFDLAELAAGTGEAESFNAAAGNAVLAAVAASDALCCRHLGRRSRGQDHATAAELLALVSPNGKQLARHLTSALAIKDAEHYGTVFMTEARLKAAMRAAMHLVEAAESM